MYDTGIIICTKNIQKDELFYLNSLKDFSIIIVDKDSSPSILKKVRKFKNIRIIKQKGNGLANARNLGLKNL